MKRPRIALGVWCLVVSLCSLAMGEMATKRLGTPPTGAPSGGKAVRRAAGAVPSVYVPEVKTAPKIDGKPADEAWAKAAVLKLVKTPDGSGNAAQPTEIKLLRDAKNLYVGIRAVEPLLGKVNASKRSHDGSIWEDDSVEMFLGVGGTYYHLAVNAVGATYDAKVKDASWNSGLTAAAGRDGNAWTATVSVPLAAMAGEGKLPTDWTANFCRNRYVAGSLEEASWSPVGSDSHSPERFGRMLLKEPPADDAPPSPAVEAARKGAVEIVPCQGGEAVVRFDLSSLKGAKIYRADLLVFRTANVDGTLDEANIDIEVYPLTVEFKGGDAPKTEGKPLPIRQPWFDRLDATDAVRAWLAGKTNGGFLFKACPLLSAENTCLDVAYEGKPENPPAQVTEVKAVHRSGQTFITFKEIEDSVGRDEIMWGEMRGVLDDLDTARQVRYCIFRSDKPITTANLAEAELLAQVKPLSGWNINGRNIEKPIDRIIATRYALMHHQWNPWAPATMDGEFGRECLMERLVVPGGEKPLDRTTGLCVHTVAGSGKAHYAVVAMVDGLSNTQVSDKNATGAIDETQADPEPVLQKVFPKLPYFNYPETRYHYVTFVAPPLANVPYQYFNWSVAVPEEPAIDPATGKKPEGKKAPPLELNLALDGRSYQRTTYRLEPDSIVLVPHDFPLNTWWYGYHESYGTLKSFRQGMVRPYTERRILRFVDWVARKWGVDRNRMIVTGRNRSAGGAGPSGWGGAPSGALHLAMMHPEVFTACFPGGGAAPDYVEMLRTADRNVYVGQSMQAVWGRVEWACKTDTGNAQRPAENVWDALNLNKLLAETPAANDMPLVTMTGSKAPQSVMEFAALMLEKGYAFMANFNEWGGPKIIPVSANGTWPAPMIHGYIARNSVLPCFGRNGAEAIRGAAKPYMLPNLGYRWGEDVVDTAEKLEVTVWRDGRDPAATDLTLRRMQNFKVAPGKTYHWVVQGASKPAVPPARPGQPEVVPPAVEGDVTVDKDGLLTLRNVFIPDKPGRILVTPKQE